MGDTPRIEFRCANCGAAMGPAREDPHARSDPELVRVMPIPALTPNIPDWNTLWWAQHHKGGGSLLSLQIHFCSDACFAGKDGAWSEWFSALLTKMSERFTEELQARWSTP